MSDATVRWITVVVLALLGVYCVSRLELTNSITHFIPSEDQSELVELSLELVDSPLARRMVLSIGGGPERIEVAAKLAETLRSHPEVAWIETGFDEEALRRIYELYFVRRVFLVSENPAVEIPELLESHALEKRAAHLRSRLGQPDSILVSQTAPADPLGLFERIVERIRASQPALPGRGTRFTSVDGEYAIVLLGLRSSPFDSKRQSALLHDIESEFARLEAASGGPLELEQSGVNRVAVATELNVRRDGNLISTVSITVVCLLFLLVFRSLRHLLIAILTPLGGFAAAMAVALSSSAPVHGITLAFGFALIGVAIDYPIHFMNHHALTSPPSSPRETITRIRASLLLSGLTTTLAFLILSLSDYPGLAEMGSFAAVGIAVSLALTLFCTPAFMPPGGSPTRTQLALSAGFVRLVGWLGARPRLALALFACYAAIAAAGLPQLRWQDDPATLMAADPSLLAESERVRRRVADFDGGRFVVGLAPDPESALALNDRIYDRLQRVVSASELERVSSLHSFLWSEALQHENLAALRATPDLGDRIDRAFSLKGFRPGAFRAFEEAVESPAAEPLSPEDLADSPLGRVLDSLVELDGRWAVVTYLRGVRSGAAIREALTGLEGAHYVDQKDIVVSVYAGFRRSAVRMVALGSLIVLLMLQVRYRSLLQGLLAFLPSALAAITAFGLFGLLGVPVNVVSAISLLVVLGMGVDYGIFTVDGAQRPEHLGTTLSGLLVSCLTSVFVFGTLALSTQPALRSIGITTGTGILLALALAPAVLVLSRRARS